MNKEKEILEYDEDESVKFILNRLPEEMKGELSADDINYIVDLVDEFFEMEMEGFLDEDDDSEIEIDEEQLFDYVVKNVRKDNIRAYTDEQIEAIIAGELAYCDSLNIFE